MSTKYFSTVHANKEKNNRVNPFPVMLFKYSICTKFTKSIGFLEHYKRKTDSKQQMECEMEQIKKQSPLIASLENQGNVINVGGLYDVTSGEVTFY